MDAHLLTLLEQALIGYVERYGMTDAARSALMALGLAESLQEPLPRPDVKDRHALNCAEICGSQSYFRDLDDATRKKRI